MASITKRKGQKYWYAYFRLPEIHPETGKRIQKLKRTNIPIADSNGRTNSSEATKLRNQAQKVADELEASHLEVCGAGDVHSRQLLSILRDATILAEQRKLTETQARAMLLSMYEITHQSELIVWTVDSWIEEWLRRKAKTVKGATMELYGVATRSFLKFLQPRSDVRLELVTTSEIRAWRDQVKDDGRTSKTTNLYHKSIKGLFKQAVTEGIILRNPADGLEFLPETDSIDKEPFEIAHVQALMANASEDWRLVIATAFYTGMRLSDITNLQWKDLDLENGFITIEPKKQRKTGKPVVLEIPIPDTLKDLILDHPIISSNPKSRTTTRLETPVFPTLAGKTTGGTKGLSTQFKSIMKNAGINSQDKKLSFHSLRHTFISLLANAGVSNELREKIAGHSNSATHKGYTHIEKSTLRNAVTGLPKI